MTRLCIYVNAPMHNLFTIYIYIYIYIAKCRGKVFVAQLLRLFHWMCLFWNSIQNKDGNERICSETKYPPILITRKKHTSEMGTCHIPRSLSHVYRGAWWLPTIRHMGLTQHHIYFKPWWIVTLACFPTCVCDRIGCINTWKEEPLYLLRQPT